MVPTEKDWEELSTGNSERLTAGFRPGGVYWRLGWGGAVSTRRPGVIRYSSVPIFHLTSRLENGNRTSKIDGLFRPSVSLFRKCAVKHLGEAGGRVGRKKYSMTAFTIILTVKIGMYYIPHSIFRLQVLCDWQ